MPVLRPQSVCNDGAGIAENLPINKMMINWAEQASAWKTVKQLRTYWTQLTQYGVEEPREALSSSRTSKSNGTNPRRLQAVTMLREDDFGRAARDRRD